jgi:hypothetical protein
MTAFFIFSALKTSILCYIFSLLSILRRNIFFRGESFKYLVIFGYKSHVPKACRAPGAKSKNKLYEMVVSDGAITQNARFSLFAIRYERNCC